MSAQTIASPAAPAVKTFMGTIVATADVAAYRAFTDSGNACNAAQAKVDALKHELREAGRALRAAARNAAKAERAFRATPSGAEHDRAVWQYMHEKYPALYPKPAAA